MFILWIFIYNIHIVIIYLIINILQNWFYYITICKKNKYVPIFETVNLTSDFHLISVLVSFLNSVYLINN